MAIITGDNEYYIGGGTTKPYVPTDYRAWYTHVGINPRTTANQAWIAAAAAYKNANANPPAGGAAPAYYGGGGGGGGGVSSSKPYLNYYTRFLNISPNKALVAKAAKENLTMTEFALLVQREDTKRFLTTWKGQEVAENFRTMWSRIFPSLGSQPGIKALSKFLKQKPSKDYRTITNPTSMRAMYAYLSGTKLFKKVYPAFAGTRFERTLDFAGYRQEKDQFKNVIRQYTGKLATDDEIGYFFKSRITSGDFEKNLSTMLTGGEAYQYATGAPVAEEQKKMAIYGRKGSAQTLAKVAEAYQRREGFQKSRQAEYMTQMDKETNRIHTYATY